MNRPSFILAFLSVAAFATRVSAQISAQPAPDPPAAPPAAPAAEPPKPAEPAAAPATAPAETGGPKLSTEQAGLATEKEAEPTAATPVADGEKKKPIVSRETGEDDVYGHGMQGGLRVAIAYGYRMVFRYTESPFCAKTDPTKSRKDEQTFCGHAGQPAIEIAGSFGATDSIEPFAWARFGITDGEPETNTKPILMGGLGLRAYTMADSRFKVLVEPAIGMEFEGGAGNPDYRKVSGQGGENESFEAEYKSDVVFRLAAGPQYDPAKAIGFYLTGGMTVGVLRAIHANLEGIFGIQVRAP